MKERAAGGNQIARAEDDHVANDHVIHRHALSAFIAHNQHLRASFCASRSARYCCSLWQSLVAETVTTMSTAARIARPSSHS